MSELTLLILRLGFLIALWVFVFFVVYAVRSDLFGQRVRRLPAQTPGGLSASAASAASAFLTSATPRIPAAETEIIASLAAPGSVTDAPLRLVITSGDKTGQSLPLTGDVITIGRSVDSSLVITDDYTSTHHARLEIRGGTWILRDLDSTNGTLLGGVRVNGPTPVPMNTPVTIGSTSFEVRR